MKSVIKSVTLTLALALTVPLAGFASEDYGAQAVKAGEPYTVEQMLTYALQDERLAHAGYTAIIEAFSADRPYTNILRAEAAHIAWLLPLFEAHGVPVPEDTAAKRVALPASLEESYTEEAAAEELNIAMYETFLAQENLPDGLREMFEHLKRGSENHLAAFQQNADRVEGGRNRPGNARQSNGGRGR